MYCDLSGFMNQNLYVWFNEHYKPKHKSAFIHKSEYEDLLALN